MPLALFAQFERYLSTDFKNFQISNQKQKNSLSKVRKPMMYSIKTHSQPHQENFELKKDHIEKKLIVKHFEGVQSNLHIIGTKKLNHEKDIGIHEVIRLDKQGYLSSITKCHSKNKDKIQENENNTFLANFINSISRFFESNTAYSCLSINQKICNELKNNKDSKQLRSLIKSSAPIARENVNFMNTLGIVDTVIVGTNPIYKNPDLIKFNQRSLASDLQESNTISRFKFSEMKSLCKRTNYHSFAPAPKRFFPIPIQITSSED